MSLYENSAAAERDLEEIIHYTQRHYGKQQAKKYSKGLLKCVRDLANQEGHYRVMECLNRTIKIKHCQKHYIFAIDRPSLPIFVVGMLHERMDFMERLRKRLR